LLLVSASAILAIIIRAKKTPLSSISTHDCFWLASDHSPEGNSPAMALHFGLFHLIIKVHSCANFTYDN
jgi:hypothetical protein